jgi:hypothetical protein
MPKGQGKLNVLKFLVELKPMPSWKKKLVPITHNICNSNVFQCFFFGRTLIKPCMVAHKMPQGHPTKALFKDLCDSTI